MSWLAAAIEWQSRAVVARHLRVYLRNWYTAFLPPALEPVTMLVAFGSGLGSYVAHLSWQGHPVEYMTYVAPGLLAYATFMTAIFQSLFGAFIRMRYQRTWEGQLTTQIELAHVICPSSSSSCRWGFSPPRTFPWSIPCWSRSTWPIPSIIWPRPFAGS